MVYFGMDIKYIAGLFDGEGYVGVVHQRRANCHALAVTITNTSTAAFPGLSSLYPAAITRTKGRLARNCYTWRLSGPHALKFLQDIAPHVIIKKEQVDLALQFPVGAHRRIVTPEVAALRADIYLRLKAMKRVEVTMEDVGVRRSMESDPAVTRAVELYRSGKTTVEVAEELGIRPPTVAYWLRQTGAMREKGDAVRAGAERRWEGYYDQPHIQKAVNLYRSGMSAAEIGKKLQVNGSTVGAWIRALKASRTLSDAAKLRCEKPDQG